LTEMHPIPPGHAGTGYRIAADQSAGTDTAAGAPWGATPRGVSAKWRDPTRE
jgi:hypothetical protein